VENVIIKFVADTEGLKPAIEQLQVLGKISEEDAKKIAAINTQQKEFLKTLNATTTEAGKLSTEIDDIADVLQKEIMAGIADGMKDFAAQTQAATGQAKTLKQELKQLKEQIASGQFKGDELQQMTKRAAELTDRIGDVNQKIRALASDTKRIDAVVGAFRGLAAAGSVAAGVYGMLGKNNEDLQKTLVKVQSAMAVLNGVQEIATLITSENAAKTLFLDGAQKLATVSSKVLTTTITTGMAAATMGISLVVAAIAGLVLMMDDSNEQLEELEEKRKKLTEGIRDAEQDLITGRLRRLKDGKDKEIALVENAADREFQKLLVAFTKQEISQKEFALRSKNIKEQLAFEIAAINEKARQEEIKKAREHRDKLLKLTEELIKGRIQRKEEGMKQELDLLNTQFIFEKQRLDNALREEKITREEHRLSMLNLTENQEYKVFEIKEKYRQLDIEADEKARKVREEHAKIAREAWEKHLAEFGKHNEKLASFDQAQIDAAKAFNMDRMELMDEYFEWAAKKEEGEKDLFIDFIDEKMAKMREFERMRKELLMAAIVVTQAVSDAFFDISASRRQADFDNQMEILELQREAIVNNESVTAAQRLKIEERLKKERARIQLQAWKDQQQADIAQAIMNTALAVTNALATVKPFPAAIAASIAAGISGAAQVATIKNQQPPRFATGTEKFIAEGTATSDSSWALLSHGERVVPTSVNEDYFPALSVIQNRKVPFDLANELLTKLATNDLNMVDITQEKKTDEPIPWKQLLQPKQTTVNINMDEAGFTKFIQNNNMKVNYKNAKFRFKA